MPRFLTKVHLDVKNTGFEVPPAIVEALGSGKRSSVNVTINGLYTCRNTVTVMGSEYMIGI